MHEPAATPAILTQTTNRPYSIERFYSLVAGASEDRICLSLREDLRTDALHAAYTIEAWLEEIKGREEKYDRLANLARAVAPISDLLRALSSGVLTGCHADLVSAYEEQSLRSVLAQRYELRQSASEVEGEEQVPLEGDLLSALENVVNQPEGRDDYVAWFQIGWLRWKSGILDEAENAFRTAASFSQRDSHWYFAQSLRHEAFVQWKRGNNERARSTIRRALEIRRDPSLLVEAARYSIACSQNLESQSLLDEALHSDPFIFVSVLADATFSGSVTSTVDLLVRQQARSAEHAQKMRDRWQLVLDTLRTAEKQGNIVLLPPDANHLFASAALTADLDFPTAIYRTEQAKTVSSDWERSAVDTVRSDVAAKRQALESATELLRLSKSEYNATLDAVDAEQRHAELTIQEEHDSVNLPIVPRIKDEMTHGLVLGVTVLVVGTAALAGISQWKFGSIPPLQPVSEKDLILISPILAVMLVFGLFGVAIVPTYRISKANRLYRAAVAAAKQKAEQQLRTLANEGTRKREAIRHDWAGRELELHSRINECQRLLRTSMLAQSTVKQLFQ